MRKAASRPSITFLASGHVSPLKRAAADGSAAQIGNDWSDPMTTSNVDMQSHRGPPLLLLGLVFIGLFLASLIVSTVMAGGDHFPSPFGPEPVSLAFFREHAMAVRVGAFFQFGAAIPLGLFTATVVDRLRFLGMKVAGTRIALFGGVAAAIFSMLSAMAAWVLAEVGPSASADSIRVLHLMTFMAGGPGAVVPLGLLVAGVSIPAGLGRLVPRWLMVFGLVIAVIAELSTLSLVWHEAAILLPLARFPTFVWMLLVAARLARSRQALRSDASAGTEAGPGQPARGGA
jgi:hypothetical protein